MEALRAAVSFERILAIDTSGRAVGVALGRGESWWVQLTPLWAGRGEVLVRAVERALAEVDWRGQELDGIAVATGPGSYTGLRVGLAVAKTLAWAWERPLAGIDTLAAMACGASWAAPMVVAAIDARRDEVFAGIFGTGGHAAAARDPGVGRQAPEAWVAPRALPVQELAAMVAEEATRRCVRRVAMAGDGCIAHRHVLERLAPVEYTWVPEPLRVAGQLQAVGMLGRWELSRGSGVDPLTLDARYLKATEAERRWRQKKS